jgi:hypothetical protein
MVSNAGTPSYGPVHSANRGLARAAASLGADDALSEDWGAHAVRSAATTEEVIRRLCFGMGLLLA